MNNFEKSIAGIIIGVAAGTALGILLSSDKGKELKEKLVDSLKTVVDEIKSKVLDEIDSLSTRTSIIGENIKNKVMNQIDAFGDKNDRHAQFVKHLKDDYVA